FVNVGSCFRVHAGQVRAIGDKPTRPRQQRKETYRWQPTHQRDIAAFSLFAENHRGRKDDDALHALPHSTVERLFEVLWTLNWHRMAYDTQSSRSCFGGVKLNVSDARVPEHAHARYLRRAFAQELNLLAAQFGKI